METILVLEDIESVRAVFTSILRRDGYGVLEAINIDEALDCQKKHSEETFWTTDTSSDSECDLARTSIRHTSRN